VSNTISSAGYYKAIYRTSNILLPSPSTGYNCFSTLAPRAKLELAGEQKCTVTKKKTWWMVKWLGSRRRPMVFCFFHWIKMTDAQRLMEASKPKWTVPTDILKLGEVSRIKILAGCEDRIAGEIVCELAGGGGCRADCGMTFQKRKE
jgi:hypothetical protein